MSKQSFAELGLSQPVVRALADRGITTPFAIQSLVIEDVLDGVDVLAKSPTGSGKTIAFAAPIVDVLDPDGAQARRARARADARARQPDRRGGAPAGRRARPARRRRLRRRRLREADQARPAPRTCWSRRPAGSRTCSRRRAISLVGVEILVLDEADRMLDMGFRPAVDRLVAQCPADRQTLFFSATLDGEVGRIASVYTTDAVRHEHTPAPETPRRHRAPLPRRRPRQPARRARRRARRRRSWRSCSCAPSAAPTGSSSAWTARACAPSRCTATSPRTSASARSPRSAPAR